MGTKTLKIVEKRGNLNQMQIEEVKGNGDSLNEDTTVGHYDW